MTNLALVCQAALSEIQQLNKALALKMDALPSGLSAGQSIALEKRLTEAEHRATTAEAKLEKCVEALKHYTTSDPHIDIAIETLEQIGVSPQ